jgi:hypothetical protein
MIKLSDEPEGLLVRKAEVVRWLGLTAEQWSKIRPTLTPVRLPGELRPRYRKSEIKQKLVEPFL